MRNTRRHSQYPVRFGIYKPTDRSDIFYYGYINDLNSKKAPKRWNTRETHQRDAWKRVQEMIESTYGSGRTIADTIRETHQDTIADILKRYLDDYYKAKLVAGGKPKYAQRKLYQNRKAHASRVIELIGTRSPYSLDHNLVDEYVKRRQILGTANSTIKVEIDLLKSALVRVLREKGATIIHKIKGHIKIKPADERETTVPVDKFEKIVLELPDWMKLPIRLQHFTGCRPSEIRELRWRNVFLDEGCLKFESQDVKEGKPRTVYLDDYMLTSLGAQLYKANKNEHGLPKSEFVFAGKKSKRIHMKAYCTAWNNACFKLGFTNLSKQTKKGRPVPLYRLHDLRRTRITALLQAGVDLKTVQKQVGHSAAAMTLKYSQPEKEAQQEMAHKINGIDGELHDKAQKRIVELAMKKKRLLDVLQGKDVWTTEDVVRLVEEI